MTKNFKKFLLFVFVIAFYQLNSHNLVLASDASNTQVTSSSAIVTAQTVDKSNTSQSTTTSAIVTAQTADKSNTPQNTTTSAIAQNSNSSTVKDSTSNPVREIDSVSNVDVNKKWTIVLSQPVDISSAKNSIKVIDKKTNNKIPIDISISNHGLEVNVSVSDKYNPESDYQLFIDAGLVSKYNKHLPQSVSMNFKTDSSITSIDDLDVTINQCDDYKLPATLTATMSDGEKRQVSVTWDKQVDTGAPAGKYVFKGDVKGYPVLVKLNLTINPFKGVTSISNSYRNQSSLQVNLYNYLMNEDNRQSVGARAIELHGGSTSNNCVYFASEALRRAGLTSLPEYICNTVQLTKKLLSYGWQICYDLSKLLPGDICFTTSYGNGPTHTYTFMKWLDPKSFDYAYICDNQGNEYGGSPYHQRNIDFATPAKDALAYFMYLP